MLQEYSYILFLHLKFDFQETFFYKSFVSTLLLQVEAWGCVNVVISISHNNAENIPRHQVGFHLMLPLNMTTNWCLEVVRNEIFIFMMSSCQTTNRHIRSEMNSVILIWTFMTYLFPLCLTVLLCLVLLVKDKS